MKNSFLIISIIFVMSHHAFADAEQSHTKKTGKDEICFISSARHGVKHKCIRIENQNIQPTSNEKTDQRTG